MSRLATIPLVYIPCLILKLYNVGITVWLSLQNGPPGGVWSYPLPNPLNMSFSVAGLQKILLATGPLCKLQEIDISE